MKVEKTLTIINKLGLHARAATQLAKLAQTFQADITIIQGDKSASAASVLGLMMLESSQGKEVNVVTEGEDAEAALSAIEALICAKFHEDE